MPRISVVVPVYDVEPYLAECLQSIARQSVRDLEVVVVDDGSRDASAQIAERFAAADRRFRVLRQPNRGLGAARNTGIDAATGDHLAFVDSDDVLPPDAYEHLLGALERTGSDFATGNVRRLTVEGTYQSAFLRRTFARTRLKTHVTRFRPLLADRTAWNKLFTRAFWDRHGLRFPEGVVHEDIPVILPAHFLARSVDVLAAPVYHWRLREGEDRSITQRRLELDVLRDRLDASRQVLEFLAAHEKPESVRSYQRWLVADDLRFHLNLLDQADETYRQAFLEGANALLAGAPDAILDGLRAIDRLKWHLVRRGLLAEAVEVVRFHHEELGRRPPVRRRGRWYGDYPFREDPRLRIPPAVFRLGRQDEDLALQAHLEGVRRDGDRLELRGLAYVNALGAPSQGSQRVRFSLLPPGRWRRLRMRVAAIRLPTRADHRPELARAGRDLSWAGFRVVLDPAVLRARTGEGSWELSAHVTTRGLSRRRTRFRPEAPELARTVCLPAPDGGLVDVSTGPDGSVRVRSRAHWALVREARVDGDALALRGDARWPQAPPTELRVRRSSDGAAFAVPTAAGPAGFEAAVPLARIREAEPSPQRAAGAPDTADTWELSAASGTRAVPLTLHEDAPAPVAGAGGHAIRLAATRWGDAVLVDRPAPETPSRAPAAPPAPPRSSPAGG